MEHDADAGVDVMTSAILRFPRGHAIFTCGMQLAPQQRAQLLGSKGHIDIGHAWNPASDQPCALVLETSDRLEVTAAERIEFAPVNQYTILAQLFARAAATGGPAPIPLEDSIKNMAVLDALRRSADQRALGDRLSGARARRSAVVALEPLAHADHRVLDESDAAVERDRVAVVVAGSGG